MRWLCCPAKLVAFGNSTGNGLQGPAAYTYDFVTKASNIDIVVDIWCNNIVQTLNFRYWCMQALFPKTNFGLDHISPVVKLTIYLLYCDIPLEAFHKLTLSVQKKSCGNVANVFLAFCLQQQFIISRSSWDRPDNAHCNQDKSDFFTNGRWHFTCHVRLCGVAAMT